MKVQVCTQKPKLPEVITRYAINYEEKYPRSTEGMTITHSPDGKHSVMDFYFTRKDIAERFVNLAKCLVGAEVSQIC